METLNITKAMKAYEELSALPANMLVNTVFREYSPAAQAHLIRQRRKASNMREFVSSLNESLQLEIDHHFTTLYTQYVNNKL